MTQFWEAYLFLGIALASLLGLVFSVLHAWIEDRRRWRHIRPHYGSVYDATAGVSPRPNIRLVRP